MSKLAIVSRDFAIYQKYFETASSLPAAVELIYAGPTSTPDVEQHADILLSEPDIASQFISRCKKLRWLQSAWAGNNKLQKLSKQDYKLTGTKGIYAAQMREYVFAYLLYFQRQIPELQALQASHSWQTMKIATLAGKRLGIMGLGNIGCELARLALNFDMNISAITATNQPLENVDYYSLTDIHRFAHDCDFIVNLLPETQNTVGICNKAFFDAMKSSAIFLNVGRGSILKNDKVLVEALTLKQIKAAVLDVFTEEPLPNNHAFYALENCLITNHTAAVSEPHKVFSVFKNNLQRYSEGQPLLFEHDFLKGY
ncbi:D-2-hydroxyacid dehydrogenase [Glaciecola sp. SC05]|uniref:D-2-hydroxyacid dehydrogenase n=1 Tax=Glaciecola sp. SC05 TaxID=1987355 RepID=UPI003528AA29